MFKQTLIKQINFNAAVIYTITAFLTAMVLGLLMIPFEVLEKIPDLSVIRRLGIPYSPTYGLVRALWCVLHGKLGSAVKYNRFIYLFFPMLVVQYLGLMRQCSRCRVLCKSNVDRYPNDGTV